MTVSTAQSVPSGAPRPRAAVARLPRYAAGKPPRPVPGLESYKLSSNENPFPPLPEVLAAVCAHEWANRYPDPTAAPLREAIAEFLEVPAEDIVTGTGGLGALTQILMTFAGAEAGDTGEASEVVYPWRSFEAYPICVGLTGARSVPVPLAPDGRIDLAAMADAINERTSVILLCSPNNPTGPALHTAETEVFLAQVPSDVVVVLDEAYLEFIRDADAVDGLQLYRKYPNVVLLRTFSKAYGLAGMRVGYSISHPELTQYLRIAAPPFAVTVSAQQAAIESLKLSAKITERINQLVWERDRVYQGLRGLGWGVPEPQGNFLWLEFGQGSADFAQQAEQQGLAVRAFPGEGVRVSIGESAANTRFLELCASLDPSLTAGLR